MSWHGGEYIVKRIVPVILETVEDPEKRKLIYRPFYDQIVQQDGDGFISKGVDPAFDEILLEFHPWLADE